MSRENQKSSNRLNSSSNNDLNAMLQSSKLNLKDLWIKPDKKSNIMTVSREKGINPDSLKISPITAKRKLCPDHIEAMLSKLNAKRQQARAASRISASQIIIAKDRHAQDLHNIAGNSQTSTSRRRLDKTAIDGMRRARRDLKTMESVPGDGCDDMPRHSSLRDGDMSSDRLVSGKTESGGQLAGRGEMNIGDMLRSKKMDASLIKRIKQQQGDRKKVSKYELTDRYNQVLCRSGANLERINTDRSRSQNYESLKNQISHFEKYLETVGQDLVAITKQRDLYKSENIKNQEAVEERDSEIARLKRLLGDCESREQRYKKRFQNLDVFLGGIEDLLGNSEAEVTSQSGGQPPFIDSKLGRNSRPILENLDYKEGVLNERLKSILFSIESMIRDMPNHSIRLPSPEYNLKMSQVETPKFRDLFLSATKTKSASYMQLGNSKLEQTFGHHSIA